MARTADVSTRDAKLFGRARPEDYASLGLRAGELLRGVPLHDVWRVDLPGSGGHRTLMDVRPLLDLEELMRSHPVVRGLFGLRRLLGRLFGWDDDRPAAREPDSRSLLHRLTARDRAESLVPPGSRDGAFTVLYVRDREAVSEIRNATVHAFSVLALEPYPGGHRLYWAVHVAPVGPFTAAYMAMIDPFRRVVIYPAILRHVHRAWCATHPDAHV